MLAALRDTDRVKGDAVDEAGEWRCKAHDKSDD